MSATASPRPLITVAETALLLGVNERTVRRKIAAGEIPAIQLGGRRAPVRISVDELQRWLFSEGGDDADR